MKWDKHYYRVGSHTGGWNDIPADPNIQKEFVAAARKRIEPWLSAVFQAEHLNLLLGSGFTTAVGCLAGCATAHHACGGLTMYVAVKGGERAIDSAHRLLAQERRGDRSVPELSLAQIDQQLSLAVDRVMTEGSLYDRGLAALAVKQARGDLIEAIFLLRAYRTTLPRLGVSLPLDTDAMVVGRRVSAIFKDLPGGQILGPTFDYTHRLLDFDRR